MYAKISYDIKSLFYLFVILNNFLITTFASEDLSIIKNKKKCNDGVCLPKCCSLDKVFSFAILQCVPTNNMDLTWLPKLAPTRYGEITSQQLSESNQKLSVTTRSSEGNSTKRVYLVQQFPLCPNYGPVTVKGPVLANGSYHNIEHSEVLSSDQYCLDVSVEYSELPHDFQLPSSPHQLMILTCFEVLERTSLDTAKEFLLIIGLITSCISLMALVVVMIILRRFRQLPDLIQLCHACSLLVADCLLLIVRNSFFFPSDEWCLFLAISMHYAFLATFFWLNVMCFDIMKSVKGKSTFHANTSDTKRFLCYCIYAWGCALLIVTISVIIHFLPDHVLTYDVIRPNYGESSCWIRDSIPLLLYFYGIVGLLLLIDVFLIIATVWYLKQAGISFSCKLVCCRPCNASKLNSHVDMFWHRFLIFTMMILCWTTEFISWLAPTASGWLLTDFLNSLQGLFLLIIFLLHPNNRKQFMQLLRCKVEEIEAKAERSRSNEYTDVYTLQT